MYYIQYRSTQGLETVDEFARRSEARKMLAEYQMAYRGCGLVYLSTRACKDWREDSQQVGLPANRNPNPNP